MSTIILFIFVAVGVSFWWLWRQKIFAKPWATEGIAVDPRDDIGGIGVGVNVEVYVGMIEICAQAAPEAPPLNVSVSTHAVTTAPSRK